VPKPPGGLQEAASSKQQAASSKQQAGNNLRDKQANLSDSSLTPEHSASQLLSQHASALRS
jgi:hypothetical protein